MPIPKVNCLLFDCFVRALASAGPRAHAWALVWVRSGVGVVVGEVVCVRICGRGCGHWRWCISAWGSGFWLVGGCVGVKF